MKALHTALTVSLVSALAGFSAAQSGRNVAVYPWIFTSGNVTSKSFAVSTITRIAENQGLRVIAQDTAVGVWDSLRPHVSLRHGLPGDRELARYADAVHAGTIIFGKVNWHTRSIWVGTGPKTISSATVDLFVYSAQQGRVVYRNLGSEGRSDEKESALKDVAAVLITPIVPMVSGGPATPREQRAVQIAIGKAMRRWARQISR